MAFSSDLFPPRPQDSSLLGLSLAREATHTPDNHAPNPLQRSLPHPFWLWLLLILPGVGLSSALLSYLPALLGGGRDGTAYTTLVFLLGQLCLIPLLAQLIRSLSRYFQLGLPYRNCLALAAIAPLPLWLASAGTPFLDLTGNELLFGTAFAASAQLCFSSINRLSPLPDETASYLLTALTCTAGALGGLALLGGVLLVG